MKTLKSVIFEAKKPSVKEIKKFYEMMMNSAEGSINDFESETFAEAMYDYLIKKEKYVVIKKGCIKPDTFFEMNSVILKAPDGNLLYMNLENDRWGNNPCWSWNLYNPTVTKRDVWSEVW